MVASRVEALREMVTGSAPIVSIERQVLYTESMKMSEGEPMILRHAKALAHVLEKMTVKILPREMIVGAIVDRIPGATLYPEGIGARVIPELEDLESRSHSSLKISQEAIDILTNEVDSYWADRSMLAYSEENTPEEIMDALYSGSIFVLSEMAGIGHVSINYPMLFSKGFQQISIDAEKRQGEYQGLSDKNSKKKAKFYAATRIVADAIVGFAERYADVASKIARTENDPRRREELERIAEACRHVPANPPRSFHEALQFIRFTHLALTLETYDVQAI
ncbi:MAG: hypothetical protein JSW05_01845 [Candidatus Thorarchaeota archaeon]|nr:MAG: hypothetical protein JSW05_01845 [Candidatus Thorarchaeota archaeon]